MFVRELGRYAEAEALHREALAGRRKALGDSHQDVAKSLHNLGLLKRQTHDAAEAEPLLREALANRTRRLGPTESGASAIRRDLGYALALQGRTAEAESLLLEAHRDLSAGRDYWSRKEDRATLRRLVGLYRREGKATETERYRRLLSASERLRPGHGQ